MSACLVGSRFAPSNLMGFSKAYQDASKKEEETVMVDNLLRWYVASSTGYPLPGCSPAEPDSVSPEAAKLCAKRFQKQLSVHDPH